MYSVVSKLFKLYLQNVTATEKICTVVIEQKFEHCSRRVSNFDNVAKKSMKMTKLVPCERLAVVLRTITQMYPLIDVTLRRTLRIIDGPLRSTPV